MRLVVVVAGRLVAVWTLPARAGSEAGDGSYEVCFTATVGTRYCRGKVSSGRSGNLFYFRLLKWKKSEKQVETQILCATI